MFDMDIHNAIQLIGIFFAPIAGWGIGVSRMRSKQIENKDKEIVRLRSERDNKFEGENDAEHTELQKTCEIIMQKMERMNNAFYDLEIKISQQYATNIALENTKKQFFDGMIRLENKLDRILEGRT